MRKATDSCFSIAVEVLARGVRDGGRGVLFSDTETEELLQVSSDTRLGALMDDVAPTPWTQDAKSGVTYRYSVLPDEDNAQSFTASSHPVELQELVAQHVPKWSKRTRIPRVSVTAHEIPVLTGESNSPPRGSSFRPDRQIPVNEVSVASPAKVASPVVPLDGEHKGESFGAAVVPSGTCTAIAHGEAVDDSDVEEVTDTEDSEMFNPD